MCYNDFTVKLNTCQGTTAAIDDDGTFPAASSGNPHLCETQRELRTDYHQYSYANRDNPDVMNFAQWCTHRDVTSCQEKSIWAIWTTERHCRVDPNGNDKTPASPVGFTIPSCEPTPSTVSTSSCKLRLTIYRQI
ncbi:hypothetical protein ABKN59_001287 [Abortiporus biennis]